MKQKQMLIDLAAELRRWQDDVSKALSLQVKTDDVQFPLGAAPMPLKNAVELLYKHLGLEIVQPKIQGKVVKIKNVSAKGGA